MFARHFACWPAVLVLLAFCGTWLTPRPAAAEVPEVLTLHPVPKLDEAPTLDGQIDDPAWQQATEYSTFYFFWNWSPPRPAVPDTTFWIGYRDEGLYVAIANYRDDMENVRANVTTRDAGGLWQDSTNEIYIDSTGTSISYRKFTFNSIGTRADQFQLDAANRFNSWTKSTWEVAAGRADNGWFVELFFPFDILGDLPEPGDTWRFAVTRFPQTIQAGHAASAPGAMYSKPQNFGWLYFLEGSDIAPRELAENVAERTSRDWFLPYQDALLIRRGQDIQVSTMQAVLEDLKQTVTAGLERTAKIASDASEARQKRLAELRQQVADVKVQAENAAQFSNAIGRMQKLQRQLENLEYAIRLQRLFAEHAGQ